MPKLRMWAYSHQGPRADQQDRYHCTGKGTWPLFSVADGMGGHSDGDKAAEAAIRTIAATGPGQPTVPQMRCLITDADWAVRQIPASGFRGRPGTTLTAAWFGTESLVLGHVGDSTCARIRKGELTVLTQRHGHGHCLDKYVGGLKDGPQVMRSTFRHGDIYLLWSDGLDVLPHPRIVETALASLINGEDPAKALVEQALVDTRDNTTCVVVQVR